MRMLKLGLLSMCVMAVLAGFAAPRPAVASPFRTVGVMNRTGADTGSTNWRHHRHWHHHHGGVYIHL